MADLTNIHRGTTREFSGVITQDAANPDITSDDVRLLVKKDKSDADADAKINELADVTTNGATGRFDFALTPTITDITPGGYHVEIVWKVGTKEYVLHSQHILILERVEDVPGS